MKTVDLMFDVNGRRVWLVLCLSLLRFCLVRLFLCADGLGGLGNFVL